MSTDKPSVSEMSREDLKNEVEQLRRDIDNLQEWFFQLEDAVTGEYDVATLEAQADDGGSIVGRIEALENGGTDGGRVAGQRDEMLPAHRMYADLLAENDTGLGKDQRRAALVFGMFVERAVRDEPNAVDASGQLYSITSAKVEEALTERGEFGGVKKTSRPQVVSRVMREVARLSRPFSCDCDGVENCTHANVRFRSSRPNKLASPKKTFHAIMRDVYDDVDQDRDGEADDASEKDAEDSASDTIDQLDNAEIER